MEKPSRIYELGTILMKKRLLIISIIYLAIIIVLSFYWQNLSISSSRKGDDIITWVVLIGILALIYSAISKLVVGKAFLVMPMVIMPFVSFTASIIILLLGNAVFGGATDYLNLRIYFYLNGITSIAYVFLVANYSIRHNSV
jgi:hypothetical protein